MMKRKIVYDFEQKMHETKHVHSHSLKENKKIITKKETDRKSRAFRSIHNAGILSEIAKSIGSLKLNDPGSDEPVIKDAIEKISIIIEEMKLDFKKDYWE